MSPILAPLAISVVTMVAAYVMLDRATRDDAKRTDAEPRKRMFTAGRWSSRKAHAPSLLGDLLADLVGDVARHGSAGDTAERPEKEAVDLVRLLGREVDRPLRGPSLRRSYTLAVNGWPVYRTTVEDSGRIVVVRHETVEP